MPSTTEPRYQRYCPCGRSVLSPYPIRHLVGRLLANVVLDRNGYPCSQNLVPLGSQARALASLGPVLISTTANALLRSPDLRYHPQIVEANFFSTRFERAIPYVPLRVRESESGIYSAQSIWSSNLLQTFATAIAIIISLDRDEISHRLAPAVRCIEPRCACPEGA